MKRSLCRILPVLFFALAAQSIGVGAINGAVASSEDLLSGIFPLTFHETPGVGGARTWLEEDSPRGRIVIVEHPGHGSSGPELSDEDLRRSLNRDQADVQRAIGIRNWRLASIERSRSADGARRVALVGSYQDAFGRTIRFEKWIYRTNRGVAAISYSEGSAERSRSRSQVAGILGGYHPFVR